MRSWRPAFPGSFPEESEVEVGRFTVKSRLFQTKGYEERIVDDSRDFQTHVLLEIRDSGPYPVAIDPVDRPIVIALLGKGLLHLGGDIDP